MSWKGQLKGCSRLYWSTVDARRRCWYRCRVLECRPQLGHDEPNGQARQEENRTIAHSPAPAGARIKVPSYSPTRRPLGGISSRPLPSPGSASAVTHHIPTPVALDAAGLLGVPARPPPHPAPPAPKRLKAEEEDVEPLGPGSPPGPRATNGLTGSPPAAPRPGRVRMKTPTARAILDLASFKQEQDELSDGGSAGDPSPGSEPTPSIEDPSLEPPSQPMWPRYSGESWSSDEDSPRREEPEAEAPPKTRPHLRFEISSEDGLSVQADTVEGRGRA
ncbi:hypothetical protein Y1Q_0013169 [Alligator mississippiensis]|uniref:Uncharacterized protein n=1 Tax=Alligator mississippiensis TaxID=8496 RepID=A0A151PJG9_ALLMI|nr:hypothetical protein Y1Q_0013169 [Alligator mississippiensis]